MKDFQFYEDIADKNNFVILKDYEIKEVSNNPINIMIWREIGDYDNQIINEITLKEDFFKKNELKNIHLIVLISQNKIPEDLLEYLSRTLEFSVIKELHLSQLVVTKYAFFNEIKKKYHVDDYNPERFKSSLKSLIAPFQDIIVAIKEEVVIKGLDLKLNKYMDKLSDIPQLMKYILYDFESDYDKWKNVELANPFENINPIGLNAKYSSSIDDYASDTLRKMVEEFLLENEFLSIHDDKIRIKMPKIEKNILQLIKNLDSDRLNLTVNQLKDFFFDTSNNPNLIRAVFLADLENRGLIEIKKKEREKAKKVCLIELNETELEKDLNKLDLNIKHLRIRDKNFYHLFTIKKRGFRVIFLEDFIKTLEKLANLDIRTDFNNHIENTKKLLLSKIYNVANKSVNSVFVPLDEDIESLEKNLIYERDKHINIEYLNSKLQEFGLEDIQIENIREVREFNQKYRNIISKARDPVDKNELINKAQEYFRENRNKLDDRKTLFSLNVLKSNKLKERLKKPFLNIIYNEMQLEKRAYLESGLLPKIKSLNSLIKKVDDGYKSLKGYFIPKEYSGSIAPKIYAAAVKFFQINLDKQAIAIENIEDIEYFFNNLKSKFDIVHTPAHQIFSRRRQNRQLSLLDSIDREEIWLISSKNQINSIISYLRQKNIIKELDEKFKLSELIEVSVFHQEIEKTSNLDELFEKSSNINFRLDHENSEIKNFKRALIDQIEQHFRNLFDLNSLTAVFKSLKMDPYVKQIQSYLQNLKRFHAEVENIDINSICDVILRNKKRIEEGINKVGKEYFTNEESQKLFSVLHRKFGETKWFTKSELLKVISDLKITKETSDSTLKVLEEKGLIENAFKLK